MNLVVLSGRLSKEPTLDYLPPKGIAVSTFDIAVEKEGSKDDDKADFFTIQCWDKLAEIVANNLSIGRKILVYGYLKSNIWNDKNSKTQKKILVVSKRIEFLDYPKVNENELYMFVPTDMSLVEGETPF